jgi:hypothetical protein
VQQLEQELKVTRDDLQLNVEDLRATNLDPKIIFASFEGDEHEKRPPAW